MLSFRNKTILVVSPDFPYPPYHGGRVDIWGRLQSLKTLGFQIDLLATVRSQPSAADLQVVERVVRSVRIIPRERTFWNALGFRPFQILSRNNLKKLDLPTPYDIVLLEGMYVLPILENPRLHGHSIILKMHNDEAVYNLELAHSSRNQIIRVFHFLEYLRFRRENSALPGKVGAIFFSSDAECQAFRKRFPSMRSEYLGGALANERMFSRPRQNKRVLFSGSLFMANNREAISWYLDEVHSRLFDIEGYEFVIVGRTDNVSTAWLSGVKSNPRVSIHENVPTLDPFYEQASVFVNPMRHGTSIKMKTIEALRNGLPVVSSTCGAMGDQFEDGRHLIIADDGDKFATAVRRLLLNRALSDQIVKNGFKFIEENYNHAARLEKLIAAELTVN